MRLELTIEPEPFTLEGEILEGGQFSGLTFAEQKALAITSQLETGKRGGFYGLSGDFDKMGLSFGLVNWNIGSGSLQPLLKDFQQRFPDRWKAAFRDDAEQFAALLDRPKQEQLSVVRRDMNELKTVKQHNKLVKVWAINDHWAAHFRRLADDPEFQAIEVKFVRDLLARAKYYCDYFALRTERAYCMMFDAVSSSGKWWLFVKNRRGVLGAKLAALKLRYPGGVPETETLRAVAETIGETSKPEWRARALERKLWFLTGKHPRANELVGLEPTDAPFTVSSSTAAASHSPATAAAPPRVDPVLDIAVISAFVQGHRDREDLTDAVFLQRHPERKGRPIAKTDAPAIAEWRTIRDRVDQLFPNQGGEHELELSAPTEEAVVTPVLVLLLAKGERDPNRLTNEAFFALHRDRERRPIARGETAAVAQWKRLRDGVVAQLLERFRDHAPPRLALRETGAGGTTLYYELRLGDEGPAKPWTAVFVPDGYRPTASVDAILYLHGHKEGQDRYKNGAAMAIDRYLREEKSAPLREGIASSGKNAILIAPTLGPMSQASGLTARGGLDRYLDGVLRAAASEVWHGTTPELRHLVLAAHSGAGIWMNRIAVGSDRAATERVRECWGFDCFYTPKFDLTWPDWARRYPDKTLWGYWGTDLVYKTAKQLEHRASNIVITHARVRSAGTAHFDTVLNHWKERVAGATFLEAR